MIFLERLAKIKYNFNTGIGWCQIKIHEKVIPLLYTDFAAV